MAKDEGHFWAYYHLEHIYKGSNVSTYTGSPLGSTGHPTSDPKPKTVNPKLLNPNLFKVRDETQDPHACCRSFSGRAIVLCGFGFRGMARVLDLFSGV